MSPVDPSRVRGMPTAPHLGDRARLERALGIAAFRWNAASDALTGQATARRTRAYARAERAFTRALATVRIARRRR